MVKEALAEDRQFGIKHKAIQSESQSILPQVASCAGIALMGFSGGAEARRSPGLWEADGKDLRL